MNARTGPARFEKILPTAQADAEELGWLQIVGRLQAPALLYRARYDEYRDVLVYEDVFASGRCRMLLGDLITLADHGRAPASAAGALVDAVCDDLVAQATATGRLVTLSTCVPALYLTRIRPGGRLDTWYNNELTVTDSATHEQAPLATLAGFTVTINDAPSLPLDVPEVINAARTALDPHSRWFTAITQGDPTEPNIALSAVGACWLDFEHAGRSTLAGEIANLLWYLLALGNWLVPVYQSDVYVRTLRHPLTPLAVPTTKHAELSLRHRRLNLHHTWPAGPGRRAALDRLLARISTDLGAVARLPADRPLHALTPFLTLRILGVIPPHLLKPDDLLLLLAKLAQAQHLDTAPLFAQTDPLESP
ncbi:hypothetical protein [Streptomyces sp. NPDC059819]|uniref:hypothetical protein n=1 Tax=Streptomyces sp. NPDC059819 TaxID=3346963 RepID=UPI0036628E2A